MIFTERRISEIYEENLQVAKGLLKTIPIFCGAEPKFTGLSGWVFEQAVLYCIQQELEKMQIAVKPQEQVSLSGRATVDLLIGKTAIEVKTSGLFSANEIEKYKKYQAIAKERGWRYVFLSIGETTYQARIIEALGTDDVILLEKLEEGKWKPNVGEWARFILIIADGITVYPLGKTSCR
jgi:hypothetical protein